MLAPTPFSCSTLSSFFPSTLSLSHTPIIRRALGAIITTTNSSKAFFLLVASCHPLLQFYFSIFSPSLNSSVSKLGRSHQLPRMAATHHHFNYSTAAASAAIHTAATDHLNMLGLRDVVFISPQQQAQPMLPTSATAALGVGVSIFPLLAATPCVEISGAAEPPQPPSSHAVVKDNIPVGIEIERLADAGGNSSGGGISGLRACRDCGNRAKKECSYRRCRTCCKSRGYDCATHVKSTWVPAAHRRERQVAMVGISFAGAGGCSSRSSSGATAKKQRIENASSASNSANLRSFSSSPFRQDASFKQSLPGQVRAPAVFRCIRVTAISNNAAEFAYLATVSISGHIFKGFLYDHGTNTKNGSSPIACISDLRLEEATTSLRNRGSPPPPIASSDAFAA